MMKANPGARLLKAFKEILPKTPPVENHPRVSAEKSAGREDLASISSLASLRKCSFSNTSLETEFESVQNASSSLPPVTRRL
jgi:hypothetical protein